MSVKPAAKVVSLSLQGGTWLWKNAHPRTVFSSVGTMPGAERQPNARRQSLPSETPGPRRMESRGFSLDRFI